MKRFLSIIISISLVSGGIFRGATHAEAQVSPFAVTNLSSMKDIYRFENLLEQFPFIVPQLSHLLVQRIIEQHAAPDQETVISLGRYAVRSLIEKSDSFASFTHNIRMKIMQELIEDAYPDFIIKPYANGDHTPIIEQSGDFVIMKPIDAQDGLDLLLQDKLSGFQELFDDIRTYTDYLDFKSIDITSEEYSALGSLYLFKDKKDLDDLGYELVSWKSRINADRDYRRRNIMAAFHNIGNVRVVMPGEIFSTLKEVHYNPGQGEYMYMSGYATLGGVAQLIYGGGLCGVATALFQGSLTNLGLERIEYKPHTIYYRNLYEAEIDGITIKDPGLDATIYSPVRDLKLKNIREYPIILVFAFDGKSGSPEQVFTISKAQDKGTFEYIGSSRKGGSTCFTRKVNGRNMTNCYSQIKNF